MDEVKQTIAEAFDKERSEREQRIADYTEDKVERAYGTFNKTAEERSKNDSRNYEKD